MFIINGKGSQLSKFHPSLAANLPVKVTYRGLRPRGRHFVYFVYKSLSVTITINYIIAH